MPISGHSIHSMKPSQSGMLAIIASIMSDR